MMRSATFLATSHETSAAILILALPSPRSVSSKVVAESLLCPLMVVRSGHSKSFEPPRVCRRLFRLSHAAKAGSTSLA